MIMASPPTSKFFLLLIASVGFLNILKHLIYLLHWLYITFLRPPKRLKSTYGTWAVVTGSTDGIGKALAIQLARHGLNLVLVSRNPTKLESVRLQINQELPETRIKTVALDLGVDEVVMMIKERLEEAIKGLDVGVVVNNVGISYPSAMYFDEVEEEVWMKMVRVNMESTSWVTRCVLPGMIERMRGAVINIGSGAGIVVPSHPLYAIYAATKAYVDQLSRSLSVEYKRHGIDVQCQVPLYVATNMASRLADKGKATLFTPTPEAYAAAAISRVGYESRCTPYWSHSLQWFLAGLLPEAILEAWRLQVGLQRRKTLSST